MAITTVANLNTYLGESDTTTAKTNAVAAACSAIETYCSRIFDSASYTEWPCLEESSLISLDQYPVTAITSVQFADWQDGTDLTNVDSTDYRTRLESGLITLNYKYTGYLKVVYTAGYSTIPADLVQIANEMAAAILAGASIDRTLASEKIGDYQYQTKDTSGIVEQFYPRLAPWIRRIA